MSLFVIAEIGINHNGDIDIAKKLIDMAKIAGCDAVKFQKRDINLVYAKELLDSARESPWGTTQRDQKMGLEFGREQYDEIDSYCKERNIEWFASAWDMNSLIFLDRYDCKYAKIASAMNVDMNLVKAVAKRKKYTFISTAMSDLEQIEKVVGIFWESACPFELMHCVGTYPMNPCTPILNVLKRCVTASNARWATVAMNLAWLFLMAPPRWALALWNAI